MTVAGAGEVGVTMAATRERTMPQRVQVIDTLATWRCPTCGVILAKLRLVAGSVVEIKCGKCNTMAVREAT